MGEATGWARLTVVLVALCVILGGAAVWQWGHWSRLSGTWVAAARVDVEPKPGLVEGMTVPRFERRLPPPQELRDTVQRPLFFEDRRPPEPGDEGNGGDGKKDPTPPASKQPPAVRLTGVFITREARGALLIGTKGKDKGEARRVLEGEKVDGWELGQVQPDGVLFRQGERVHRLPLRPETPPVPLPQAGRGGKPGPDDAGAGARPNQRRGKQNQ